MNKLHHTGELTKGQGACAYAPITTCTKWKMRVHGHGTKDKLHIDTHIFLTCAEYIKGILLESMCCGEPRTGHVQSKTKEKCMGMKPNKGQGACTMKPGQQTGCKYIGAN